jgi:hypothetical protein
LSIWLLLVGAVVDVGKLHLAREMVLGVEVEVDLERVQA